MSRRLAVALVAFGLVAVACNSRLLRPPAPILLDGGGETVAVSVDDTTWRYASSFHRFFPEIVPLHPGDEVRFELQDTGEPHTLAMGKLIDQALVAIEKLGPAPSIERIENTKEMKRLPKVLPDTFEGQVPTTNQSAVEPCYLSEGTPPVSRTGGAEACPETDQPEFDGSHTFYSAGLMDENAAFRVQLAGDAKPGTYAFMCMVHRSNMVGFMEIRDPDVDDRPAVSVLKQNASDQQGQAAGALELPTEDAVAREGGPILAGLGPPGQTPGTVAGFIPEEREVGVSEDITWQVYGNHSITFEPSSDALDGVLIETDGRVDFNPAAWKPVNSPIFGSVTSFAAKKKTIKIGGGTWDGQGTLSSGIIRSEQPRTVQYKLKISAPGTYGYRCVVHPQMRGKLIVS